MARSDDRDRKPDRVVSLLAKLDASVARGLADADAGRVHDLEAVAEALDARYAAAKVMPKRSRQESSLRAQDVQDPEK